MARDQCVPHSGTVVFPISTRGTFQGFAISGEGARSNSEGAGTFRPTAFRLLPRKRTPSTNSNREGHDCAVAVRTK
eukprot:816419-Rhodomonas_salina.1